jgi:hypothetical protein
MGLSCSFFVRGRFPGALLLLLCVAVLCAPALFAQTTTYVETTTAGPSSNVTRNGTMLKDFFLLAPPSGTAATKSISLNASALYAAGFTTAVNVPGLTTWPAST